MPRVLNVKKLEEKFQTLSRSKESIQGLATWIMHHKEVYVEIVQQWLIGISNDCNTLSMFYVANEIIQGCGKKKCPEFRDAFSNVLGEAVSFDHVKEYRDKILRLLNLWKERNLFVDELYQTIENKLKDSEELESSDEDSEEDEKEESELDIIQHFKKEILIDRVNKLKLLESKRQEKEDILNYADVPELPNLEDIAVRKDCKDAIRKCDAYLKLSENYTKLMAKEISMRKRILKELNRNSIFYTAQQKDVREVANAFRVYGKRVKLLETKLEEKIATFSSSNYSPSFSESSVSSNSVLSYEAEDASKSYLSPYNKSDQSFLSSNSNDSFSFSGKVSSKLVTEIFGGIKQSEKNAEVSKISDSASSKEAPSIKKEKTQSGPLVEEQAVKEAVMDLSADSGTFLEKEYADFLQCLQTGKDPENKPSPQEKGTFSEKSTKSVGKEIYSPSSEGILSESNSSLPIELYNAPDLKETFERSHKNSKTKENEDVDLLLEESFDKKSQTKLNFKRKIELLLKSNAKKHCIEQQTQEISDKDPSKKVVPLLNLKQELKCVNKNEDLVNKSNNSKVSVALVAQNSSSPKNVKNTEKIISHKTNTVTKTLEVDIASLSSLIESVSDKTRLPDKSPVASTCSDSHSADQTQTLPLNTNATFTGIPMSTFVSNSMPSRNAKQPENKTLSLNPTATFTGMNLSSIMSILSTDVGVKDAIPTDTKETAESDLVKKKPVSTYVSNKSVSMPSKNAKQPENATLTFNPTATFTGMNMSSILSMLSTDACAKDTIPTETKEETSSDLFKEMPMTSFMPKMCADLSTEGAKQPENFSKDIPGIASSPPRYIGSEVQQQTKNDSYPKVPALSSFMFDMSTDFLKNILKINQQNTVKTESNVEHNNFSRTEQQARSNSSDKEVIPLISNAKIEESFKEDFSDSSQVANNNSQNLMQTLKLISEKIETKAQVSLHNRSIELNSPSLESVSKSVKLEADRSIPTVKETQEILSCKDRQSTVSDNLKSTAKQALDTKPSLLKTLKDVLVCLTENMHSKSEFEMSSIEKDSELEPSLPIESMLKIYSYVHGCNTDYFRDNSASPNTVSKTSIINLHMPSVVNVENNYEVMDMECDSEGETA